MSEGVNGNHLRNSANAERKHAPTGHAIPTATSITIAIIRLSIVSSQGSGEITEQLSGCDASNKAYRYPIDLSRRLN